MLKDHKFKSLYNSKIDSLIDDFYVPAMTNSIDYRRISAYFDSKILRMYASGIEIMYGKNGRVRFIFSTEISEEDYNQIKMGYELQEKHRNKLMNSIDESDLNLDLSNLAYLVAIDFVDIRIAFTKEGIFHDKFGLFQDEDDNILYFRGSNNETSASVLSNYESFETSVLFESDKNELYKISRANQDFEDIWNNQKDGVICLPVPECVKNKIITLSKNDSIKYIYQEKVNSIVFGIDENNRIYIFNNLFNKSELQPGSLIYMRIRRFIDDSKMGYIFLKVKSYRKIQEIITEFIGYSKIKEFNVYVTPRLRHYLFDKDIMIDKRKNIGIAIKKRELVLIDDFNVFKKVVDDSLERILREPQLWDAYHMVSMIKSANFSVPGSGKTSVVYGAFAYLKDKNLVDKIVMIGPKNSFRSWKLEFDKCFGNKLECECLDIQESAGTTKKNLLKYEYKNKNLILVNYESAVHLVKELNNVIDEKTLLVFDEVHRVKGINGVRAKGCLSFSNNAKYKVALTGTPIPNSYKDIYNLLNILFEDEYESFFDFDVNLLENAHKRTEIVQLINEKIYPFYCRTTKQDLSIPLPYPDDIGTGYVKMNHIEEKIMEIVYSTFGSNPLILFIRLLQASSNPALLLEDVNIDDYFDSEDFDVETKQDNGILIERDKTIIDNQDYLFVKNNISTRKIDKSVEIIANDVKRGNQVVAWGMFISNLYLVQSKLSHLGVNAAVICGHTPNNERNRIINMFEKGEYDVLVTNPHTLGESISLHKVAHHAVYFEYSFNLTHMLQSRDRIHRLGITEEERPRYTYMFLSNEESIFNTIDKKVYLRLKDKEKVMIDAVEKTNITLVEENYMDDILEILGKKS
jgi:hypothetical protein